MKRSLLLLLVLVLVAVPGCSYLKLSNQPPRAYIGDISPTQVTEGEVVRFSGYGTDADGQAVGYRWRSDRDGQLSQLAEFETSSLSVGEHTIYFRVQDNNGA